MSEYTYDIILRTEIGDKKEQLNQVDMILNSGKKRFHIVGMAIREKK